MILTLKNSKNIYLTVKTKKSCRENQNLESPLCSISLTRMTTSISVEKIFSVHKKTKWEMRNMHRKSQTSILSRFRENSISP